MSPAASRFSGCPVGLCVRRLPLGIARVSLLWAFLEQQGHGLQVAVGVSSELVFIIQGVIVLAVVIAYEVVRRAGLRMEQRNVARQLSGEPAPPTPEGVTV